MVGREEKRGRKVTGGELRGFSSENGEDVSLSSLWWLVVVVAHRRKIFESRVCRGVVV